MVDGRLKLAVPPTHELHLASVVDAEGARLVTIGEDHLEVGQLHVGAVLGDETLDIVAPSSAAQLADDGERRFTDVGQSNGVGGMGRVLTKFGFFVFSQLGLFPLCPPVSTRCLEG
jgi:hypothetical protein